MADLFMLTPYMGPNGNGNAHWQRSNIHSPKFIKYFFQSSWPQIVLDTIFQFSTYFYGVWISYQDL